MPLPFQSAADRFGLPTTGAQPEQFFQPEDDAIARYRQYLNTGSDVLPVAQPPGPDLDESDWSAISQSADPMTTLKLVDQLKSRKDYSRGVQEIGALDWSNPAKAAQDLAQIYAKRPNAGKELQQFGSGVYKMLGVQKPAKAGPKTPSTTMTGEPVDFLHEFYQLNPSDDSYWEDRGKLLKKYPDALNDTRVQSRLNSADTHYHSAQRFGDTQEARDAAKSAPKALLASQQKLFNDALSKYQNSFPKWYGKPDLLPENEVKSLTTPSGARPSTDKEWWDARVRKANELPKRALDAKDELQRLIDVTGDRYAIPDAVRSMVSPKSEESSPEKSSSPNTWKITPIR